MLSVTLAQHYGVCEWLALEAGARGWVSSDDEGIWISVGNDGGEGSYELRLM